jgi:hypothetical protein
MVTAVDPCGIQPRTNGIWSRRVCCVTGAAVMMVAAVGCNSERPVRSHSKHYGGPVVLRVMQWKVVFAVAPKIVRIIVEAGYCVGRPKPWIQRADMRYQGDGVYLKAEVAFPRWPRWAKGDCAGVGLFLYKRVELKRDLADVRLYDAKTSPPSLRWSYGGKP